MRLSFFILFALCCTLAFLSACKPENLDPNAQISFTQDTLRFDTVFVNRGSATRYFKIKNNRSVPVNVSEIRLAGGNASQYRINIDGAPVLRANDIEIAAKDSMYVFVQVNIDPNNQNAPFIVTDSVVTLVNGVEQRVVLEAFGQNANYIGSRAGGAKISCALGNTIFDSPRPYVIYGWLIIDSCDLIVKPGNRIYVHGGIVTKNGIFDKKEEYPYFDGLIYVTGKGSIRAEGTLAQPILFAGDRLEHSGDSQFDRLNYSERPSQWTGIYFAPNSKNNKFSYCNIRNAGFGINADSATTLTLKNTIINNHSAYALTARHAENITAENCLFFSASNYLMPITYGGNYTFTHCTLGSFGSPAHIDHKDKSALYLTNSYCAKVDAANNCIDKRYHDLTANFTNCIIYGSLSDEVKLVKSTEAAFNVSFTNCILKRSKETLNEATVSNCIFDNPKFKEVDRLNYRLDTLSAAAGKAASSSLSFDLEDKPRKNPSSIGCYETKY
jgi:Right handed beta helix region